MLWPYAYSLVLIWHKIKHQLSYYHDNWNDENDPFASDEDKKEIENNEACINEEESSTYQAKIRLPSVCVFSHIRGLI